MQCLEAQHLSGDPLDETMILLKNIIQIFNLQDFDQLTCWLCRKIFTSGELCHDECA